MTYNIYCDESCHLEHDGHQVMVLGALWCPKLVAVELGTQLRALKADHGIDKSREVKWVGISPAKAAFYRDVVHLWHANDQVSFRALIIPDKTKLVHASFGQTHNDWYYKMYYFLLNQIVRTGNDFHVYLDYKDTQGPQRAIDLMRVLKTRLGRGSDALRRIQVVRSDEVPAIQIADVLLGAVSYANRGAEVNQAKGSVVNEMQKLAGVDLRVETARTAVKLNLFRWRPTEVPAS